MKDDPHETAMTGSRAKPSILTIASIFLAAILGVSLLLAPGTVFCPKHTSYLALPLRPVEH